MTRGDLSPGNQATQSVHAALQFSQDFRSLTSRWFVNSSFLVLLQVPDEGHLIALSERLTAAGRKHSDWREPDWGDSLTAIAVEPGDKTSRLLSNLPLLLKEVS